MGTVQYVHRCGNGLGVSVIPDRELYEIAVIHFYGPGDDDFDLIYDTPITGDVLRGLTVGEVNEVIRRVAELPHRPYALESE
jgi:hypothetical protein